MDILRKLRAARQLWSNWRGTHDGRFSIYYRTNRSAVRAKVFDRLTRQRHRFELRRGTTDIQVFAQTWIDRQYDVRRLLRQQDIQAEYAKITGSDRKPLILDVGANCGTTAAYFKIMYPSAEVVAIEPEDSNYRILCLNARPLSVSTKHAAVGSFDGYAKITDSGQGQWAYRTTISREPTALPLVSVPTLLAEYASCSPFLLKVDVEGAEKEIFSGDISWVDRFPIIAIELHDWMLPGRSNSQPFLAAVSKFDRDFIVLGELIFSVGNRLGITGED